MGLKKSFLLILLFGLACYQLVHAQDTATKDEIYRPQFHFTPDKNWNNDPNGLVYYKGEYHLFYQYYPEAMEWGPMHWGHAVSSDLLHWKNLPIALYPDSLGYIFSGSAVVDKDNTAGFQKGNEKALVAIFTYHKPETNIESQAIAYSTDKGRTWTKYKGNPVIPNAGINDFRDPKVRWFAALKEWVMVVSSHDHIAFYTSPDLKKWTKESDFGKDKGSHGGVWECPDLFPLKINGTGETKWILTVNNGGSPAGGGGTQYFIGNFDGHSFMADDNKTRWLDGGADEYAGVTWSNTGSRTIFIGWMNNWPAANKRIPSYISRGGMTLPMELSLKKINDSSVFLMKQPVEELRKLENPILVKNHLKLSNGLWIKSFSTPQLASSRISLKTDMRNATEIMISLQNESGQHVDITYDKGSRQLEIDRTNADSDKFHASSSRKHSIKITDDPDILEMTIFYDRSTLEVFFDGGRYLTTDLVFPTTLYDRISIHKTGGSDFLETLKISSMRSVWR